MTAKKRYEVGLHKLAATEASVQGMQQELIELQPQLEVAAKETEAAMEVRARTQGPSPVASARAARRPGQ